MRISPVTNSLYSFGSEQNQKNSINNEQNPISKKGEKALLVKATFLEGLLSAEGYYLNCWMKI